MSRRTSRKSNAIVSYKEEDEIEIETAKIAIKENKSPKIARKAALEVDKSINGQNSPSTPKINNNSSVEKRETTSKIKKPPLNSKVKPDPIEPSNNAKDQVNRDSEDSPEKGKKNKRKAKLQDELEENKDDKKVVKKRKSKEEKDAETMPLAARTAIQALKHPMYIGAHVSAAGGVQNSINNAVQIGANSFALFLKSQRKWTSPPMTKESQDQFHSVSAEQKYDTKKHVLPHGSYLVNLAQADAEKAEQAYACFLDDLLRCESLGITLYNFHPGNTNGLPRPAAISRIASNLNRAHAATSTVVTLLENMAGSGNTVGSTFEDLRDIIALVDDKSRIGVCIDTCHAFAAGYDLRSPESFSQTMQTFDSVVGTKYLRALHLNDSKAPFGSRRDLHANIGTGFLGLRAFHNVMNCTLFEGLPMVLETPIERMKEGKMVEDKGVWAGEIKLLEGLVGRGVESEGFREDEKRLSDEGEGERRKFQGQADRKVQKTLDGMFKKSGKEKGAKTKDQDHDSDSEVGCSH